MRPIYKEKTANYPRLSTDRFFVDYSNSYEYGAHIKWAIDFVEKKQLLLPELWKRFVECFRLQLDSNDGGWQGELWGKMMRGGCFVYSASGNEELYKVLRASVEDLLTTKEPSGRISSFKACREFFGWDIWGRKYVLLGLQYFLEICKAEDKGLADRIVESLCCQVDYIIGKIGDGEGQIPITDTSGAWRGLNSSSILEPIVRLYSITGEERYLGFAEHIVSHGGTQISDIFKLALEDNFYPYQYPITKAYEMISCFEGLLEYYRVTGIEEYKTAVLNFGAKLLESDFTVIGSSGCAHEQFDHSTVRQANPLDVLMQETCVTVTVMKFLYQLHLLTGDSKYADAFEISLYNAYLGAFNTEDIVSDFITKRLPDAVHEPLPFDSYSPLTSGKRGGGVGGLRYLNDRHYYGCCACIGSAGIGLVPKMQLLSTENGFVYNLFAQGKAVATTKEGNKITFVTETDYPKSGAIRISIISDTAKEWELLLRNPYWSENTEISVNGERVAAQKGYTAIKRLWKSGDCIELCLDMRTRVIRPIPYGSQIIMTEYNWDYNYITPVFDIEDPTACKHIALQRGPICLSQDSSLGYDTDKAAAIKVREDGFVDAVIPKESTVPFEHIVEAQIPLENGQYMTLTDYSSAGKNWNSDAKIAVWILTE